MARPVCPLLHAFTGAKADNMYGSKASLMGASTSAAALPATGLAISWYLLVGITLLLIGASLMRMVTSKPRRGRHTRHTW